MDRSTDPTLDDSTVAILDWIGGVVTACGLFAVVMVYALVTGD